MRVFQLRAGSVNERLALLFPSLRGAAFTVDTADLAGNAWNTVSVRHHRVRLADGTQPVECIEKQLAKVAGIPPYEPRMQAWAAAFQVPGQLLRTPHLGVIDTPLSCFLYSQVVSGPHVHMVRSASEAARGIAELEAASAAQLREATGPDAAASERLDFFRPWSLWRTRYNLALALARGRLRRDPALDGILGLALQVRQALRANAQDVAGSPRCFSHLDMLSKNLIAAPTGLHLIDWGEGRVGRVGFDAGSYLHRLLRGNDPAAYDPWRNAFMGSYLAHLPAGTDQALAQRNAHWFLALRSTCYFLRPDVLRKHRAAPREVEAKLALVLAGVARTGRGA